MDVFYEAMSDRKYIRWDTHRIEFRSLFAAADKIAASKDALEHWVLAFVHLQRGLTAALVTVLSGTAAIGALEKKY